MESRANRLAGAAPYPGTHAARDAARSKQRCAADRSTQAGRSDIRRITESEPSSSQLSSGVTDTKTCHKHLIARKLSAVLNASPALRTADDRVGQFEWQSSIPPSAPVLPSDIEPMEWAVSPQPLLPVTSNTLPDSTSGMTYGMEPYLAEYPLVVEPLVLQDSPVISDEDHNAHGRQLDHIVRECRTSGLNDILQKHAQEGDDIHSQRHQWIQGCMKQLMEQCFRVKDDRQQLMNTVAIAESAKHLRWVHDEDYCYDFLARWSLKDTFCDRAFLVRIDALKAGEMESPRNHSVLIMCPAASKSKVQEKDLNVLLMGMEAEPFTMSRLRECKLWLVDPALDFVEPLSKESLKKLGTEMCETYGYEAEVLSSVCTEQFNKFQTLTAEQESLARYVGRQLLVMAVVAWAFHQIHKDELSDQYKYALRVLNRLSLKASDVWPDKMRPNEPWNYGHIRCLKSMLPVSQNHPALENVRPPNDFDVIACYRIDSREYIEAIKKQCHEQRKAGMSLLTCIERMSDHGFCGGGSLERPADQFRRPYAIPPIGNVPDELVGTTDWQALPQEAWTAFGGLDSNESSLKGVIERFLKSEKKNSFETARADICREYSGLWRQDPNLKSGFKTKNPQSRKLLVYLIHQSGAEVPAHLKEKCKCNPIITLSVCRANSGVFKPAMKQFLQEGMAAGKNAIAMAKELSSTAVSVGPNDLRKLLAVELPEELQQLGYTSWTAEAVKKLIEQYELEVPDALILIPEGEMLLYDEFNALVSVCKTYKESSLMSTVGRALKRNPELAEQFAIRWGLVTERVKKGVPAAVRYLLKAYDVPLDKFPESEREKMEKRPADLLGLSVYNEGDWKDELLTVIKGYLKRGHSLTYIAMRLREGDKNSKEFTFPKVPLPDQTGTALSYDWNPQHLHTFLDQYDLDIEQLKENFPESAFILKMEHALLNSPEGLTLANGLLIDRMLSPVYPDDPETSERAFSLMSTALWKRNIFPFSTRGEIMKHYRDLVARARLGEIGS